MAAQRFEGDYGIYYYGTRMFICCCVGFTMLYAHCASVCATDYSDSNTQTTMSYALQLDSQPLLLLLGFSVCKVHLTASLCVTASVSLRVCVCVPPLSLARSLCVLPLLHLLLIALYSGQLCIQMNALH